MVILVDEYDKPVTDALLLSQEKIDEQISILKEFYGMFKAEDKHIRFCFITGVSRFSKVSIFSDINNLKDISLLPEYATLCGYTKKELVDSFQEYFQYAAEGFSMTQEDFLTRLQEQYNGYRFSSAEEKVFNPFSILNCLADRQINNYWFETATPSFLVRRIRSEKKEPMRYDSMEGVQLGKESTTARQVSTVDLLYDWLSNN